MFLLVPGIIEDKRFAQDVIKQAKKESLRLVGPGDLLNQLTETILETALEVEMEED